MELPTPPSANVTPGRSRRTPLILAGAAFAALLALLLVQVVRPVSPASAQADKQAAIVVQFDDSARAIRSIHFSSPISGLAALQLSGLNIITHETGFGPAVCSIENVGCPADNCFCDPNRYWGYSWWDGTAWQSYAVGAGDSVITQTDAIEGWRWGQFGDAQIVATQTVAAHDALAWLAARQVITDGSYGGASASVESMLAIGANLHQAGDWRRASTAPSLQDALALGGAAYARVGAGAAGKLAAGVVASGACMPAGALTPAAWYSDTLGAYSNLGAGDNAWALLGALALGEEPPAPVVAYLKGLAQSGGGWEWAPGWGVDTNATSLVIQALVGAGEAVTSTAVSEGIAMLHAVQNDDGGFPYSVDAQAESDANSTAFVVQALIVAGEEPDSAGWTKNGKNAIDYLMARQQADGGIAWQEGGASDLLATQQAISALLGRTHPIAVGQPEICSAAWLPAVRAGEQ